jgi:hypothetical protein
MAKPKHKHKWAPRFLPGHQKRLASELTHRTIPPGSNAADLKRCCTAFPGKVMYPTPGWAENACDRLRARVTRGASLDTYRCDTCEHWHIGNNPLWAFTPIA